MLNMDFSKPLVIDTANMEWVSSPSPMVLRKPLEREAAESGHVTSVVQYLPQSSFAQHSHPLGEEIFVLEGVFSDETGDYGPGTYLRNPPGSAHTPFSQPGCIILVKLNQFQADDLDFVRINTLTTAWQAGIDGAQVMPLHAFKGEQVSLMKWPVGVASQTRIPIAAGEVLVLSGSLKGEQGYYPKHTWLRSSDVSQYRPAIEEETVIWIKTGHLPR
ncbi:cupin domain-containing protein [Dasania marina]|uniref:cupin domain-containing protein n=1 Tax=Dasania marina TaxID=471499 RepID=UPI0030DD6E73|tara:strand:- start:11793 stop:12443 length:651 start_codon:yes stop_codon:yes gene_type:complete